MTQRYIEHMHTNDPVHTWPWASKTAGPRAQAVRPAASRKQ